MRTIGVIAGKGIYPETFIEAARKQAEELRIVLVAFKGETDPALEAQADSTIWIKVGQLGKMGNFLKKEAVPEAVMVGQITPSNLFNLQPDLRTIAMLAKLKEKNAESIFSAIADEMSKDGVTILSALTFLDQHMAPEGHIAGPSLKKEQEDDATYGIKIAKSTSELDIGQSVVVRQGTVLAVEAFEGTNKCIQRGGDLGKGKHCLLAKVSKPNQDLRFDVPVIGPDTVKNCAEAGVNAIVVEAHKTLILDKPHLEKLAKELNISVIGLA